MTSLSSLVSLSVVGLCCQCCCLFVLCLSFPAFLCPLSRMLFGHLPSRELCCCSRNCCWFSSYLATLERSLTRTFLLLFIRFPVICQVLGGVPDNAALWGALIRWVSLLFMFVYCLEYIRVFLHCRGGVLFPRGIVVIVVFFLPSLLVLKEL